jgi:hypothetical protein
VVEYLARAFDQLISQELQFAGCTTDVNGGEATATCQGQTTDVPRARNRRPRVEAREWSFGLRTWANAGSSTA